MPAVVVFLLAAFRLLNIEVITLSAFQKADERDRIIEDFNEFNRKPMVFLITYAIGSTGLNLQKDCHRVHLVEGATNLGTLGQSIGRVRRLGNPSSVVYVYEYYVNGTFDSKNVWRNIEKAVPQAMAELNRQIFYGEEGASDGTIDIDLGDWVLVDDKLVRADDIEDDGEERYILTAHEVLRAILVQAKGEHIELW